MKSKFKIKDPDSVEMTMEITMTVGDWKILRNKVSGDVSYPSHRLNSAIRDLVNEAESTFIKKEIENEVD